MLVEYGVQGAPRPFVAEFRRNSPPRTARPDELPWPGMPTLATLPEMLMATAERSMPLTVGAAPKTRDLAELYPSLRSLILVGPMVVCHATTPFCGTDV